MEQGIANDSIATTKAQLDIAKSRRAAAVSVLKTLKTEFEELLKDHASLVAEKDTAVERAQGAVNASKEIEKTVEELTLELITRKEFLESARAALLEAEEQRIVAAMVREQETVNWNNQLKQADEEVQRLNQQIIFTKDLKSKLGSASALLLNLKAEMAAYRDSKLKQERDGRIDVQASVALAKKELEEVKLNIEKAIAEVTYLKVAAISLKSELETEKSALIYITQREEIEAVAVESLTAELNRIKLDSAVVQMKERESRKKMVELPRQIQEAAQEADKAKALAQMAREELRKVKEVAERAKAGASTVESRLLATQKEIEAAKASENLALAVINALQESESVQTTKTLPIKEYYELSKRAHEAEELANKRLAAAMSEMEVAKESELKSLNKLKDFMQETAVRKEALEIAMLKAEKAMEGKLGVEQELKKWRAEHNKQEKVCEHILTDQEPEKADLVVDYHLPVPGKSSPKEYVQSSNKETDSSPEVQFVKKKSLLPRMFMFLAKKKVEGKSM